MYSLYKGGPENFGKSRMQEKPSARFFRLILKFIFFINQFSLFFLLFFKIFRLFFIF